MYHSGGNNNLVIMGGQTAGAEPTAGTAVATFASGGDVTVNTGTLHIPDALTHSGDTDTKIRFPSADTFSVETAGSERLRFDSSGRIIKGHTSTYAVAGHYPSVQLTGTTFNDATLSIINNANDSTGSYILLSKQRSGSPTGATIVQDDDLIGQIMFSAGDGTDLTSRVAEIKAEVDGTPGSNDTPGRLLFKTTPDGAQSSVERLRIDQVGNISIGGIAPVATSTAYNKASLHIHQTTSGSNYGSQIHLTSDHTGAAAGDGSQLSIYSTSLYINNQENGSTYFYNNGSPTATILANGNFGVGTQAPTKKIEVNGDILATSIYLGGSASANQMDDYEEGTWTPTMNAGITISNVNSTYVKIGRSVTAKFYVNIPGSFGATAGTSTDLEIGGLPFTAASNGYHTGVIDVGNGGKVGAFLRTQTSATNMVVLVSSGSKGTARDHLNGDTIGGGDYVIGSVTYQTD